MHNSMVSLSLPALLLLSFILALFLYLLLVAFNPAALGRSLVDMALLFLHIFDRLSLPVADGVVQQKQDAVDKHGEYYFQFVTQTVAGLVVFLLAVMGGYQFFHLFDFFEGIRFYRLDTPRQYRNRLVVFEIATSQF